MDNPGTATRHRRRLRSLGAVVAGVLAHVLVVGAIDAALRVAGVYPPMYEPMTDGQWALALACRVVFAVVGGMLTARLAPAWPMRHVLVLGCIETLASVSFVLANWNRPEFGPHWFAIIVVVTALPGAALGGVLASKGVAHAG